MVTAWCWQQGQTGQTCLWIPSAASLYASLCQQVMLAAADSQRCYLAATIPASSKLMLHLCWGLINCVAEEVRHAACNSASAWCSNFKQHETISSNTRIL